MHECEKFHAAVKSSKDTNSDDVLLVVQEVKRGGLVLLDKTW